MAVILSYGIRDFDQLNCEPDCSLYHTKQLYMATVSSLIPFGIRSQSCFLILPASESLINHAISGNIRKQLWLRIPNGIISNHVTRYLKFSIIERVIVVFKANSAIVQLYHGENKLIINEMMMKSALYQTNMLSLIFIVLAH